VSDASRPQDQVTPLNELFDGTLPDDYDDRREAALAALETLPRDDDWQRAKEAIENMPSPEEYAAASEQFHSSLALLQEMSAAVYEGFDATGAVAVKLDFNGSLIGTEFGAAVSGWNGRLISVAVSEAWEDAEARRAEGTERFTARAEGR
jgi:hypothetical protein